jgi:hypothetical protein
MMSRMTGERTDPNVRVPKTKAVSLCRDKRIFSTGCAGEFISPRASVFGNHFLTIWIAENTKMNDCYFEKKDWRLCKNEVREASSFEVLAI